jgi:hypothetical protein
MPSNRKQQKRPRASTNDETSQQESSIPPPIPPPPAPSTPRIRLRPPHAGGVAPGSALKLNPPKPPQLPAPTRPASRQASSSAGSMAPPTKLPKPMKPPASGVSTSTRPGLQTRQTAIQALQEMGKIRSTPPPPFRTSQLPSSLLMSPIATQASRRTTFFTDQVSKERQNTPERSQDSDDDEELAVHAPAPAPTRRRAPVPAPAPISAPAVQQDDSDTFEIVEYTIYVTFTLNKVSGPKGQQERRTCIHTETLVLNTDIALSLSAVVYSRLLGVIQTEVQAWNLEHSLVLGAPEITAIPKHSKLTKKDEISFSLTDSKGWKPIAKELIRFVKQNKSDLRVDVEFKYNRPIAISSSQRMATLSQPQSLTAGGHVGGRDFAQAPLTAPGRRTTTQRQLESVEAENLANPMQQAKEVLGTQWLCKVPSCINAGGHCWWEEHHPERHYTLTSTNVELWRAQIMKDQTGRFNTDEPPPKLKEILLKARNNQQRSMRRATSTTSIKYDCTSMNEIATPHHSTQVINVSAGNQDILTYFMKENSLLKQRMDDLNGSIRGVSYSPFSRAPSSVPQAPPSYINPPSSPISPTIPGNVDDFVDWLINKMPGEASKLQPARTLLHEHEISMQQIQATKDGREWKKYGIKIGAGWLLTRHIKEWERSQHRLHTHTPEPPQARSLAVRPSPRKQRGGVVYKTIEADTQDTQANIETMDEDEEEYSNINNVNAELYRLTDDDELDL